MSESEAVGWGETARGLISTESRASAEWRILIRQHYRPAKTGQSEPKTSWAELSRSAFPACIIWGHDRLLLNAQARLPHSCQTRKNSMAACDEGAGSNSNAGLNQYIPMVSNRHCFSSDGFRVSFWFRTFQFTSILWSFFAICGVFIPVRNLWHCTKRLRAPCVLWCQSKLVGYAQQRDRTMLLRLKMSQQYRSLIMPFSQPTLLEQLRATC